MLKRNLNNLKIQRVSIAHSKGRIYQAQIKKRIRNKGDAVESNLCLFKPTYSVTIDNIIRVTPL